MQIQGFELVNKEKLRRVIEGNGRRDGSLSVGLGEFEPKKVEKEGKMVEPSEKEVAKQKEVWESKVLAEYDKIGGLILKDGSRVKTGCFFDLKKKKPHEKVELIFVSTVDNMLVEVNEEEAKALSLAQKKAQELKAKAKKKLKK